MNHDGLIGRGDEKPFMGDEPSNSTGTVKTSNLNGDQIPGDGGVEAFFTIGFGFFRSPERQQKIPNRPALAGIFDAQLFEPYGIEKHVRG